MVRRQHHRSVHKGELRTEVMGSQNTAPAPHAGRVGATPTSTSDGHRAPGTTSTGETATRQTPHPLGRAPFEATPNTTAGGVFRWCDKQLDPTKGGRQVPGPKANPVKPNSRHRSPGARSGLIELPAEGCDLPIPTLPKTGNWSPEDKKLWRNIWKSPQANEYDDSFVPAVAAYVCHARAVYEGTAAAWQAQEMRHLGGQLGLTPAGMLALGWVVKHG